MNTQSRARNFLELTLAEFKSAMKIFTPKRRKLGPALLAFEGGFLSIESGEATAIMHASGEWHGRATFSPQTLRAIATIPPNQDPLTISYADSHLLIGNMNIACQWQTVGEALINNLENPSLFDLLVMERTLPRSELKGTERGHLILDAVEQADKRIRKAMVQLAELGVSEAEIRALVEAKIKARLIS